MKKVTLKDAIEGWIDAKPSDVVFTKHDMKADVMKEIGDGVTKNYEQSSDATLSNMAKDGRIERVGQGRYRKCMTTIPPVGEPVKHPEPKQPEPEPLEDQALCHADIGKAIDEYIQGLKKQVQKLGYKISDLQVEIRHKDAEYSKLKREHAEQLRKVNENLIAARNSKANFTLGEMARFKSR